MKKSLFQRMCLLLACFTAVVVYAAPPKQTTITCKVNLNTGSGIFLYRLENGEAVSLGFRRPDKVADTCIFSLPLEKEGVYFLRKAGVHSSEFKYAIYLKPGENKQVDFYLNNRSVDYDSCKIKNANKETTYLGAWTNQFNSLCKLVSNRAGREEFMAGYSELIKNATALKAKAVPSNAIFHRMFGAKLETEIQYLKAAAFFYNGEGLNGGCDTATERRSFYQSLSKQNFCDDRLLQSEHGLQLVKFTHGYQLYKLYPSPKQMQDIMMSGEAFAGKAASICSKAVRAAYVADRMEQITNYEVFKRDIQPFKTLFTTTVYKTAYQKKEDELTIYAKGAKAYNFSLEDTKGQMVSLSDFKGKVVVLDVWAMWCGPCLQEKPFYQKIEEEFEHRDDIVFIGISHDGTSRKEVWKNFVARKGWENIELIANSKESIGKYYKIEGIPRFMIFDKEGKIVTVDAPRPSNPAFKQLIDQTLENN